MCTCRLDVGLTRQHFLSFVRRAPIQRPLGLEERWCWARRLPQLDRTGALHSISCGGRPRRVGRDDRDGSRTCASLGAALDRRAPEAGVPPTHAYGLRRILPARRGVRPAGSRHAHQQPARRVAGTARTDRSGDRLCASASDNANDSLRRPVSGRLLQWVATFGSERPGRAVHSSARYSEVESLQAADRRFGLGRHRRSRERVGGRLLSRRSRGHCRRGSIRVAC
jgi:hypothetical protein